MGQLKINELWFTIIMLFIFIGSILFIIIRLFVVNPRKRRKAEVKLEKALITEPKITKQRATVIEKVLNIVQTGTYRQPSHLRRYDIRFKLDDEKELLLDVGADCYYKIYINEQEELITVNGKFLDFGGRFGEDIE